MRIVISSLVVLVALVALGLPAHAQGVDVTGTWNMSVQTDQGSGDPVIVLKQDGERLTGSYQGQLGSAPVTGTVKGQAITISFRVNAQGTEIDAVYEGTVDGKTMKGTVNMAGGQLTGTFTGTKQ